MKLVVLHSGKSSKRSGVLSQDEMAPDKMVVLVTHDDIGKESENVHSPNPNFLNSEKGISKKRAFK